MYKVGYAIGYIVFKTLIRIANFILDLLSGGIVVIYEKSKPILAVYIILYCAMLVTSFINNTVSNWILAFLFFGILIPGIWFQVEEYPNNRRRKYFDKLFEIIGLCTKAGSKPYYVGEQDISDLSAELYFYSSIPISDWYKKRDLLEIQLNTKIISIEHTQEDKRELIVTVQKEPLPSFVEWKDAYRTDERILYIGISYSGMVGINLTQTPHVFIAGETGSGKSNLLKCLIHQALMNGHDVILIDFKRGVSFSEFQSIGEIYYEYDKVKEVLQNIVKETRKRLDYFREKRVDNLQAYNEVSANRLSTKIIFIDELAELLKVRDKELSNSFYDSLETITRLSRATGIHLIMGVQRPDSTIINGQIKSNVSCRICGRFVDKEPSQIVLGSSTAAHLPNIKGRFIVKDDKLQEVQTFYYHSEEKIQYFRTMGVEIPETNKNISYNKEDSFKETLENQENSMPTNKDMDFIFDFSNMDE